MILSALHRKGRPALWAALLFTVALWIASVAYTQSHPSPIQKSVQHPAAAEASRNNEQFGRFSDAAEKPREVEEATKHEPAPKQIEQPNPKTHPHHFEPPVEPEFIPEEAPSEDLLHIV